MATQLWMIFVVLLATFIGAFGAIFLKKASSSFSFKISFLLNKYFLISLIFYGISMIFYLIALKYGELSTLYPIVATTYIWVSIFSQKFLGEKMNKFKWFGIAFIILGVLFLTLGS